jgi:hypothetical protein
VTAIAAPAAARNVVVIACALSAGIHAGLVPAHLGASRPLGIAFAVSATALLWAAASLAAAPEPRARAAGAAVILGALIAAYTASRTVGLPLLGAHVEPVDPVGLVTQVVQAAGACAALRLCQTASDPRSPVLGKEVP